MKSLISRIKFAVGYNNISLPKWLFQVSVGVAFGLLICVILDFAKLGWTIGVVLPTICFLLRRDC